MKANKGDTITINKPGHLLDGITTKIEDISAENSRPIKVDVCGDWFLKWDEIQPVGGIIISERHSDKAKDKKSLKHSHSAVIMASDGVSTIIKTENGGNSIDNLTYIAPLPFETVKQKRPYVKRGDKPKEVKPKRKYERKQKKES